MKCKNVISQHYVDHAVKSLSDIMRRGNCAGALQYVPELTWIFFLRLLDEKENQEEQEADALGIVFRPSIEPPYRWRDWAAPPATLSNNQISKRAELQNGPANALLTFVNTELLPYLKCLKNRTDATARQKIISEILANVTHVRIDTEQNFLAVLDKVHEFTLENTDSTHIFTLSRVYEGLLLKMGEKGSDGGQFFTPRPVIRAMVQVIEPQINETIYDPGCGTGGFLAQSFEYISENLSYETTAEQLETLKQQAFWGREKENLIYPIALANLVLHGIDKPNIWHGNTLTGMEIYGDLFKNAPQTFDVILANPPFGGKEGMEAQAGFEYKTSSTQVLFLQHVIQSLREGGRCGIVMDEGFMFRTNDDAFTQTKRKLLDECDLWCVVSLPSGVFSAVGAEVKTNILFFTKGRPTRKIWYYELPAPSREDSRRKVRSGARFSIRYPITLEHFDEFFRLLPQRADSEHSWTVDMEERKRCADEEALSLKEQAAAMLQQADQWREKIKKLKRDKHRSESEIEKANANEKDFLRKARALISNAKKIEDAVYDLKAVNPNRKKIVDTRTPKDIINTILAEGVKIAEAMDTLRAYKTTDVSSK